MSPWLLGLLYTRSKTAVLVAVATPSRTVDVMLLVEVVVVTVAVPVAVLVVDVMVDVLVSVARTVLVADKTGVGSAPKIQLHARRCAVSPPSLPLLEPPLPGFFPLSFCRFTNAGEAAVAAAVLLAMPMKELYVVL
jgi:hypothetical protein